MTTEATLSNGANEVAHEATMDSAAVAHGAAISAAPVVTQPRTMQRTSLTRPRTPPPPSALSLHLTQLVDQALKPPGSRKPPSRRLISSQPRSRGMVPSRAPKPSLVVTSTMAHVSQQPQAARKGGDIFGTVSGLDGLDALGPCPPKMVQAPRVKKRKAMMGATQAMTNRSSQFAHRISLDNLQTARETNPVTKRPNLDTMVPPPTRPSASLPRTAEPQRLASRGEATTTNACAIRPSTIPRQDQTVCSLLATKTLSATQPRWVTRPHLMGPSAVTGTVPAPEPTETHTHGVPMDSSTDALEVGPVTRPLRTETAPRPAMNAALQPLVRRPDDASTSARTGIHAGNFVRLNLRNKAGSCRGARTVKTKTKAQQKWHERQRETLNQLATRTPQTATSAIASNAGLDAVDDYIDGVFESTDTKTKRPKNANTSIPLCSGHQQPCKLLTVKKTGPNKGRKFYACPCPRGEQCHHFVWADDTVQAAQQALLKNKSISGFIARQVASYMTQIKCLTVPELKNLAQRHSLETAGKKAQLLTRLSIWVRDQVAKGTRGLETDTAETAVVTNQSLPADTITEDCEDDACGSNESDNESCGSNSTSSSTDELELTGEGSGAWSQCIQQVGRAEPDSLAANRDEVDDCSDSDTEKVSHDESGNPVMLATLRKLFGFTSFRNGQAWAINRCLNQMRSLLVAPTGFGKSLCFALPAAMLDGVCIVVSPLLSLIQDQMQVLPARLPAVTLSGPISSAIMASTLDDIIRGRIKVVFVSPERLTSASFRRLFRPKWNPETQTYGRLFPAVSLLCVDEAHCLSQWAHNFRPSYLRLRSAMDLIQPQSVLAITATAGPRVVRDICHLLQIESSTVDPQADRNSEPMGSSSGVHISKTDRDNIDVKCLFLDTQEERLTKLVAILSKAKPESGKKKGCDLDGCLSSGSVIVYVWRQMDAEVVAENLQSAGINGGIVVYHGGMDTALRTKAQSKFMRGKARVCVATIAFGLGINKADVAGVVHLYLSSSPEHYIQEIGRAGRNGKPAQAVALVLKDEVLLRHSLAHSDLISRSQVKSVVSLVYHLVNETLTSLPPNRSKDHPISIALPIATSVVACDCKAETIETIISLLEQRIEKESLLVVEGVSYDSATITPRRASLQDLAQKEIIAQAMLHCTDLSKPHEHHGEPQALSFSTPNIVHLSHSSSQSQDFGSFSLSVAKCSNCLGESGEPRHVFAALRRLESCGEIDFKLDTSPQNRVLSVRLTNAGMDVFKAINKSSLDGLVDETMVRFVSSISSGANKVIDVNHVLQSVSQVSRSPTAPTKKSKSESLTLFQSMIGKYFEAEGRGEMLVEANAYPAFFDGYSLREVTVDAQMILSLLQDIHGGIQGRKLVTLGDPSYNDYTSLMITKFLHGLVPASVPIRTARQHHLFGKLQSVQFGALQNVVASLFQGTGTNCSEP